MKSTGDPHSLSAPGDYRDEWNIPGRNSDARADNEGISAVRDAGAEEPVCWRENSSSKRRWTDDEVIFISEPTPAVVESVQRECADGREVLEMCEGPSPLRCMANNIGGGRQGTPQGSRSSDVHASCSNLDSLFHRVKVRIIAQSDSSTEDIMSEVLCRRQHASTHAQENMSLASTEAVMAAPDDQPRLVPPAHPFSDTVRGSLSALRRQPSHGRR
ncbi:hypothetical protein MRX96_006797 [Rhipicephalus microplus]